jgi:hypothetical protein
MNKWGYQQRIDWSWEDAHCFKTFLACMHSAWEAVRLPCAEEWGPYLSLCASRLSTRHRILLQINRNLKQPAENDDRIFTIRSEAFVLINCSFTYRTLHKVIWHLFLECAKVNIVRGERHTQLHRSTAMSSRAPTSMVVLLEMIGHRNWFLGFTLFGNSYCSTPTN